MDQRKQANQTVKDRLLSTLIATAGEKDWSKLKVTELIERSGVARASFYRNFKSVEDIIQYGIDQMSLLYHANRPFQREDFHDRAVVLYKFQFYRDHAGLVLAFHRAKISITLLDVITDCEINACGDMPHNSISRYELYYFSGAFYNMMLSWLEGGAQESPEAMADEFLRIANHADSSARPEAVCASEKT